MNAKDFYQNSLVPTAQVVTALFGFFPSSRAYNISKTKVREELNVIAMQSLTASSTQLKTCEKLLSEAFKPLNDYMKSSPGLAKDFAGQISKVLAMPGSTSLVRPGASSRAVAEKSLAGIQGIARQSFGLFDPDKTRLEFAKKMPEAAISVLTKNGRIVMNRWRTFEKNFSRVRAASMLGLSIPYAEGPHYAHAIAVWEKLFAQSLAGSLAESLNQGLLPSYVNVNSDGAGMLRVSCQDKARISQNELLSAKTHFGPKTKAYAIAEKLAVYDEFICQVSLLELPGAVKKATTWWDEREEQSATLRKQLATKVKSATLSKSAEELRKKYSAAEIEILAGLLAKGVKP